MIPKARRMTILKHFQNKKQLFFSQQVRIILVTKYQIHTKLCFIIKHLHSIPRSKDLKPDYTENYFSRLVLSWTQNVFTMLLYCNFETVNVPDKQFFLKAKVISAKLTQGKNTIKWIQTLLDLDSTKGQKISKKNMLSWILQQNERGDNFMH